MDENASEVVRRIASDFARSYTEARDRPARAAAESAAQFKAALRQGSPEPERFKVGDRIRLDPETGAIARVPISERAQLLDRAKGYVTQDRATAYGSAEDNFQAIADLWNAALPKLPAAGFEPWSVAIFMDLLKTARILGNHTHQDSWDDKAGYTACGWETVVSEVKRNGK
jgi:hypothetical protein